MQELVTYVEKLFRAGHGIYVSLSAEDSCF